MSTASLPPYVAPPAFARTPSYTVEPRDYERRLALGHDARYRPSGHFIKESRSRAARLCLSAQEDNADLPVYGSSSSVEGTIEISKPEGIQSVEVKVRGTVSNEELPMYLLSL